MVLSSYALLLFHLNTVPVFREIVIVLNNELNKRIFLGLPNANVNKICN